MAYHTRPRDDAWKQITLTSVAVLGLNLWLRCDACGHNATPEPLTIGKQHGLDPATPLLTIDGAALHAAREAGEPQQARALSRLGRAARCSYSGRYWGVWAKEQNGWRGEGLVVGDRAFLDQMTFFLRNDCLLPIAAGPTL
jgi:hypothetical protein